jgi:hypothetical protein
LARRNRAAYSTNTGDDQGTAPPRAEPAQPNACPQARRSHVVGGAASVQVELEVERGGGALEACLAPRKTTPVGDYVSDPVPISQHLGGGSREVRKPPTQQPMRPRRIRRRMVNPAQPTPRPLTTLGRLDYSWSRTLP